MCQYYVEDLTWFLSQNLKLGKITLVAVKRWGICDISTRKFRNKWNN